MANQLRQPFCRSNIYETYCIWLVFAYKLIEIAIHRRWKRYFELSWWPWDFSTQEIALCMQLIVLHLRQHKHTHFPIRLESPLVNIACSPEIFHCHIVACAKYSSPDFLRYPTVKQNYVFYWINFIQSLLIARLYFKLGWNETHLWAMINLAQVWLVGGILASVRATPPTCLAISCAN